jgi:mannose-6-phosphate isomerase
MLYPLKFEPLYKDYVWGGRNLSLLGKTLPDEGIVAESWEVSCHKNGSSIVANGEFQGIPLPDLIQRFGRKIIGDSLPQKDVEKFPLLVKLIDAQNNLSVQVHPDDAFANKNENGEYGKNEMWYIISAKQGARLVYDVVPGTTRETLAAAIAENRVEACLKTVDVFAGDVINIPAGLVHAIGRGIVLAEVQQNSDTTYRVYDYGRTGRALHIEKALNVIDFNSAGRPNKYTGLEIILGQNCSRRIVIANNYFCTEVYHISGKINENADGSKFYIYTFTAGSGSISWKDGKMDVSAGLSLLIPASMGEYSFSGDFTALKSYIPDLESDIIKPLLNAGKSLQEIKSEIGGLADALKL